jgi:hypothetical protein
MSFEKMEAGRRDTAEAILSKFGATLEKAEGIAAQKHTDPWMKKVAASRVALEYAVLATAREKNVPTQVAGQALQGLTIVQQAAMVKNGTEALGNTYRIEPDVLVNAFAGQMMQVEMPKGLGSTPEIDKMVDTCRNLVTNIVKDEYATRGRFTAGTYDKDSFIALKSDGVVSPTKSELASRLAFMESSIDAAAARGAIAQGNANMLKERIESQVFQPRPPQSLEFSKEFNNFFEQRGKGLRIEAMKEVRSVTQSQTVQEITAKLKMVIPSQAQQIQRPADARVQKPMER